MATGEEKFFRFQTEKFSLARMNLTQIKNATEGDELKDHVDDPNGVRGLQLRVRGGNKAFFLYYRNSTGQRRRPKIGDFPAFTLQAARDVAKEWLGEVSRGKDPSSERASLRASETVSELADRYLDETKGRGSWRHDDGRVRNYIKPKWGKKRAAAVTPADLHALKREMSKTPVAFNRLSALISQMWKFGKLPPIHTDVKRNKEKGRQRYLSPEERERFEAAMDETFIQYPHAVALIRGLDRTGARRSELSTAKRAWYAPVRLPDNAEGREHWGGVLTLRRHKTDGKVDVKVIIFDEAAHEAVMSVDPRGGWLFGFSSNPWAAWKLIRERAKLEGFHLHDLRHSLASDLIGEGADLAAIAELLGHADLQTTKRYAHLATAKKRELLAKVAASRRPASNR